MMVVLGMVGMKTTFLIREVRLNQMTIVSQADRSETKVYHS